MEGHRIPEAVTSALSVAALLGVGTFIQGYVLRQSRPPPFPPPDPVKSWSDSQDIQWRDRDAREPPRYRWMIDRAGIVSPASGETATDTAFSRPTAAIQLPLSPVPEYRYYCGGLRRYYPDVVRCSSHWQIVPAAVP